MAKLNDVKIKVGVQYGYMDNNWNWIPYYPKERKETTMRVTQAVKTSVLGAARNDRDTAIKAYQTAKAALDEAERVLAWAATLQVGGELSSLTINNNAAQPAITFSTRRFNVSGRYYVASRSGLTKGHYLYLLTNGKVDCSCPGFVNRGTCWASKKLLSRPYEINSWAGSHSVFDNNRDLAYNVSY